MGQGKVRCLSCEGQVTFRLRSNLKREERGLLGIWVAKFWVLRDHCYFLGPKWYTFSEYSHQILFIFTYLLSL